MRPSIKIEGTEDIRRKLLKMADATRKSVVLEALEAGGEIIAEEARRLVPVRTGTLRDSIIVSSSGVNFAGGAISGDGLVVYVGPSQGSTPDGFYGHMVEYGTFRSAPRPFMRPAFDNVGQEAADEVTTHLAAEFMRLARE